jgi:hypothetical protein
MIVISSEGEQRSGDGGQVAHAAGRSSFFLRQKWDGDTPIEISFFTNRV